MAYFEVKPSQTRTGDFDSSLNLPQRVEYPPRLAEHGGSAGFAYEISANPGLRYVENPALRDGKGEE